MSRALLTAVALLLLAVGPVLAKRPKPTPCPPERYVVVEGAPLVGGAGGTGPDVVAIGPKQVTISGGCVGKAMIRASRTSTTAHARWKSCPPLKKVTLAAKIAAPECREITGTLRARKAKPRRFRAVRSTCGDGQLDAVREACDAGQGCAAAERCTATCVCDSTPLGAGSGAVELPPGSTLSLTALQVIAPGASAIRPDGSFDFAASSDPILVLIADGDGVPVLAAYSDPRQSGALRVNARSTALAMLFFASGAFTRAQSEYQQVRDLLAAHPAFATLAAAVEARLGVEPHAIAAGDPALLAAIQAAIDAMSGRGVTRAVTAAAGAPVVSRLLADPQAELSGIIVSDSDDQSGLQITNRRRRHLLFYVTQTGYLDSENHVQQVDRPVVNGSFPHDWISSTNKLGGVFGSVTDVFSGNGAYQPYTFTPAVPLPVFPDSAREAYYHVTVVGPGGNLGAQPKMGLFPFLGGASEMVTWSVFKDIFLPFLFAGLDVHLDIEHLADPTPLFQSYRVWITGLGSGGHVVLSLTHLEIKEFMLAVFKTIADDAAFRQVFINWFRGQLASLAPDAAQALSESALNGLATKLNFWLFLIDKAMSLGDAAVAAHDMANSNWFEEWDVTAIPVPVRLLPPVATVTKSSPAVTLTTTVTGLPNHRFVYRYSTAGFHGLVCPILGDCATTVDSIFDNVLYVADALGIVEGDLDTVTVEVFDDTDGNGTVPAVEPALGKATSRIVGEAGCAGPEVAVNIPSAELRTILHQRLGVAADQPITCADMERLTTLGIVQRGIETLEGLQFAVNLTALTCNQCVLREIGQVSRLHKLTFLALTQNGIIDVSPLAGLTALTSLNLEFNRIVDVRALAGLTNLQTLNLRGNTLNGIDALAGLTKLEQLFLRETGIASVTSLAGLVNLETLTLNFCALTTLDGLQGMTKLAHLEIDNNYYLEDIGALANLNALNFLDANTNSITSIAPLAGKTQLAVLDLSGNQIADLSPVDWAVLPLDHLNLRVNLITSIAPLQALTRIGDLDVSYNRISDAGPISGLHTLTAFAIRNNLLSSLKPLVDNSGLGSGDSINIQQNCLSESDPDIKTLKDRGARVSYQPQGCTP